MNFLINRLDNATMLRYELLPNDVYDVNVADNALRSQLFGMIPFRYDNVDGRATIDINIYDKLTLNSYLKKTLNKEQVLNLLYNIISIFDIGVKGIPISYIVRDTNFIYVNDNTLEIKYVLLPLKQEILSMNEVASFFRGIVSVMIFDEKDKENYVARILNMINNLEFTVSKFKGQLTEMLDEFGVFVKNGRIQNISSDSVQPNTSVNANNSKVNKMDLINNQKQPPMGQPPMGQPPMMGGQPPMKPQQPPMGQPPMMQGGVMQPGGMLGQLNVKPVPHLIRTKTGEEIKISKPEFSIGKSKSRASYTIENNSAISRVHCIIMQKDGVNYIKDNNSTNNTYLNGVIIEPGKEEILKNKSVIKMGDEEFVFYLRKGE